ncbi:MAG: rhomboid family intramembrane serine protease, partial [Myxococcales bacterium]|nr:rhomboid family intramembrane serine protease [Myxococcales bacterium]
MTATLVGLCIVVFVATFVATGIRAPAGESARTLLRSLWTIEDFALMQDLGALTATRVWLDGEWWRVLTAGFLHGSWLHLILNMLGLWAVGRWTERAFGPWWQLVLFVVSSVGGILASLAFAEAPMVVGASAGIFGVAGALVVARAWGRDSIKRVLEPVDAKRLGRALVFWLLVGFALPLVGVSLLAQAGHV